MVGPDPVAFERANELKVLASHGRFRTQLSGTGVARSAAGRAGVEAIWLPTTLRDLLRQWSSPLGAQRP